MTKNQLTKLIEQLTTQGILKEFTTRFQSPNMYRQYHVMDNDNARLVIMPDLLILETEHGTIQVLLRHVLHVKYHFVTDTIGMLTIESKFVGRNRDCFTTQSLTITHNKEYLK